MAIDKAIDSAQLDANLTAIADAIRTKGGTSDTLVFPAGFVSAVQAIQAGGGGDSVTDDGNGNITINALYSFTYTDDGNGNLTGSTVSGTSATDNSGNVIFG